MCTYCVVLELSKPFLGTYAEATDLIDVLLTNICYAVYRHIYKMYPFALNSVIQQLLVYTQYMYYTIYPYCIYHVCII